MSNDPDKKPADHLLQHLYVINKLLNKVHETQDLKDLIFTILNDTYHVVKYNRALLWNMEEKEPVLLGVSGQAKIPKKSLIYQKWNEQIRKLKNKDKPQFISIPRLDKPAVEGQEIETALLIWLPLTYEEKPVLGFWLEIWGGKEEKKIPEKSVMKAASDLLLPAYLARYKKLQEKSLSRFIPNKKVFLSVCAVIFFSLFVVHVPLRVVAPCEVVSEDPYLITAPIEGIIDEIMVDPGDIVKQGDLLLSYEKELRVFDLRKVKRELQSAQSEYHKAFALAFEDPKWRDNLSVLEQKMKKGEAELKQAQYYVDNLEVFAPIDAVVSIQDPDRWRGKPVKAGDPILLLQDVDTKKSKVKIWIAEADNIPIDFEKDIKIFLNVHPEKGYRAKLEYIAGDAVVTESQIPSFQAQANWVDVPDKLKLGWKGSAVLYGEQVTLAYFLFRRPLQFIRKFTGI